LTKVAIEGASVDGEAITLMQLETGTSPYAPRSGRWWLYFKPDGLHYMSSSTDFTIAPTTAFLSGKQIFVDSVYGSDTTGTREKMDKPFKTIEAALAVAVSGDAVFVGPGTYTPASGLTIPAGVALVGVARNVTTIQKLNVTGNTTLVTMGNNSHLENFTLTLTSAQHHTLKGIAFPGATPLTAKIRTCTLTVDNSGATASGTSEVYGIHYLGSGSPTYVITHIRACNVVVNSIGLGKKRGFLSDTAVSRAHIREFNALCTGGSDSIGVELNKAGSYICFLTGVAQGSTADISRTASGSTLELGTVELETPSANGKSFTGQTSSGILQWSDDGGLAGSATRYMRIAGAAAANEIMITLPKKGIIQRLRIHARIGPGLTKNVVFTIRKNGVDTALTATLSGIATNVIDDIHSVGFAATDEISLKFVTGSGDATTDVNCAVQYV
jgi:hypothetical protein